MNAPGSLPPVPSAHDDDHLHEECAVFGIWNARNAAALTTLGLHALQHRGQEAAGIVSCDDNSEFYSHRGLGLVSDVFSDPRVMATLKGNRAIGHNRYATTGATLLRNVQPLFAEFAFGGLAVAHNGNLTNSETLRKELILRGCLFQSTMDTEVFVHLIATSLYATVEDRLIDALKRVTGAYSLVVLSGDALIGARDPMGVRPLVLGRLSGTDGDGDSWVLASETCGLDIIGAEFVRDIEPGELVIIDNDGVRSLRPFGQTKPHFCIFEYIYFARPDSVLEGLPVYAVRKQIGQELARESGVEADIVVPVPDSGVPSAMGYAEASGIPFELGIIRNHYVGRTFIEPTDQIRNLGVKMKHSTNRPALNGKRVILVDDSIVRGTTSRKIVDMVRAAGAKEVHMRISSPPTQHSCFYGIDTPERSQLLAAQHDLKKMAELIGVDSLAFISQDGLYRAMGYESRESCRDRYCDACFTGDYPIPLIDHDKEFGTGTA
ncbi:MULTISPECIES: amidophosphoribosyltransferase [Acetobacter]|uniref:Amidophosphoribosyltransferase n=1 Tax=Acetobacter thailandicus TaxID=1502842 RepID=A0ABT3QGR6_9PROT|nr:MULTISPECIES: amidophosphoribosyltransferase [Acetobacter]MBS0960754.1 amidophosphoribosyltransferase [Acetobacter thailandicus]MBS0980862.1 amidophosphoribosyltransferase [Acetobacter thailandicus]MBS0985832.1 amidophosphoribosyltransferase [Acetobacter thailandicus]MBS1004409.1 amidophosphoribosyltransferase [Acetobacter thailandicus]MCX2564479.1 amidophosphoribosyltransferase [Acetobacter thailandicus]